MAKQIEITILEDGVRAVADLSEEDAPRTCEAMWQILEKPIQTRAKHSIWCGRKITLDVPLLNRVIDPLIIPRENQTVFPSTGAILWNYWPPRAARGFPEGLWDLMLIYGPESIMKGPLGQEPCNIWAQINQGLDEFIRSCSQIRISGTKTFRVQRLGS